MRIESGQILQAGGLKVKTKPGTLQQSLKKGDKLSAHVVSCDKNSVSLKTEDGQIVKARLEPGVTLTEGEEVTLEVTRKEDGVLFLSVGENEPGDSGVPKNTLAAARGFEDTSLEPQAQKLLELRIPVREETARAMRELMEANPGMKPEEAAFLASNGITQDSGLIKAALALLSGEAKPDELVGLMLKLLEDTPENGEGQSAGEPLSLSQDKTADLPPNKTGLPITNLRGEQTQENKTAAPAVQSTASETTALDAAAATGEAIPTGKTAYAAVTTNATVATNAAAAPNGAAATGEAAANANISAAGEAAVTAETAINTMPANINEQTTLTGFINAFAEQISAETDANHAVNTPNAPPAQESNTSGDTTVKTPQEAAGSAVPQELESKADSAPSHQNIRHNNIIPQSDTILQNEFSTSGDIKQKILTSPGGENRTQLAENGENRQISLSESVQNQEPAQPMQENIQNPQTVQKTPEFIQYTQNVKISPESAQQLQNVQKPEQTAAEPLQNRQIFPKAQEPVQSRQPIQTAQENPQTVQTMPEPIQHQQVKHAPMHTTQGQQSQTAQTTQEQIQTAQTAQTEQKNLEQPQTVQTAQTEQKNLEQPQSVQTAQTEQKNPEQSQTVQTAQTEQKNPEQTQNAQTAQKTGEQTQTTDEQVSRTLAKILAEMPEFKGTPERALTRFSEMLLGTARDGTEPAGDVSQKLSAMLEKMFCQLEKDDVKAGERLRQAKDELYMRLSMIEETVAEAGHPAKTQLLRETQKLMDNVRLINSIDQFVYMQLPVKIGGENRTADLYVYKRKRGSKGVDPDNVNILLTLDLDSIGHWESLVNIKGKEVSLRMEVAGENEKEYFSENTVKLHNLLAEAGFRLSGTSIELSRGITTPLTAPAALERFRTGRAGAFDYTI